MSNSARKPCAICSVMRQVNYSRPASATFVCRDCRRRPVDDRMDWAKQSACAGVDSEVFYDDAIVARGVYINYCGPCPVRAECYAHALASKEQHGVWGGLTPAQRGVR